MHFRSALHTGLASLLVIACGGRDSSPKPTTSRPSPEAVEVENEENLFEYTKSDHKSCVLKCVGDDPEGMEAEGAQDCEDSCEYQCNKDCAAWRQGNNELIGYCDSTCDLEWDLLRPPLPES